MSSIRFSMSLPPSFTTAGTRSRSSSHARISGAVGTGRDRHWQKGRGPTSGPGNRLLLHRHRRHHRRQQDRRGSRGALRRRRDREGRASMERCQCSRVEPSPHVSRRGQGDRPLLDDDAVCRLRRREPRCHSRRRAFEKLSGSHGGGAPAVGYVVRYYKPRPRRWALVNQRACWNFLAIAFLMAAAACASGNSAAPEGAGAVVACVLSGSGVVRIVKNGTDFNITRDGAPYFVKGVSGQAHMDRARQAGANSLRTYASATRARCSKMPRASA